MVWTIKFKDEAQKDLKKLPQDTVKRILKFLFERISKLNNPRSVGAALHGPKLKKYWKYRIGDYRIIAEIYDKEIEILVIAVGHRKDIYKY